MLRWFCDAFIGKQLAYTKGISGEKECHRDRDACVESFHTSSAERKSMSNANF